MRPGNLLNKKGHQDIKPTPRAIGILLLFFAVLPGFTQTIPTYTVILRDSLGQKISTADSVSLIEQYGNKSFSSKVDSYGSATFADIPSGNYFVMISAFGSYPEQYYDPSGPTQQPSYTLFLNRDDSTHLDFVLTTAPMGDALYAYGTIEGKVVSQDGSTPLQGIVTYAIPDSEPKPPSPESIYSPFTSVSDTFGHFRIDHIPVGSYRVMAMPDSSGYIAQYYHQSDFFENARVVSVDSGAVISTDFSLRMGATIKGTVTDKNGSALQYMYVNAVEISSFERHSIQTDISGSFEIKGIPQGTYRLEVYGPGYFLPKDYFNPEYQVTEGETTIASTIAMERGAKMGGEIDFSAVSLPDTMQMYYFDLLLFDANEIQNYSMRFPFHAGPLAISGTTYRSEYFPAGSWQPVISPEPLNYHRTIGTSEQFSPWFGWTLPKNSGTGIASSPLRTVLGGDSVTNVDFVMRPGYSVFGTLKDENGQPITSSSSNYNWTQVRFFVEENGQFYSVAESFWLPDGRFEIPGLIDGEEYFVQLSARDYPIQFWSPSGVTQNPTTAYRFSTSSFQPLDVTLSTSTQPPMPSNERPLDISAGFSSLGEPMITITLGTAFAFDSLKLLSRSRRGEIRTIPFSLSSTQKTYRWTEPLDVTTSSYEYIAIGWSGNYTFRSNPVGGNLNRFRTLPPDSLWIDLSLEPGSMRIEYGGGENVQWSPGDSMYLYKRDQLQQSWVLIGAQPIEYDAFHDHNLESFSLGATVEYKAGLRSGNVFAKWSPIGSYTFKTEDLALFAQRRKIEVGTGRQFTTIQSAVESANSGDLIVVFPGDYTENIVLSKNVELVGAWQNGVLPRIDGQGGTAITIPYHSTGARFRPRIQGFQIVNATTGILTYSDVEVRDCLFKGVFAAVRTRVDPLSMEEAIKANPFIPSQCRVDMHYCTFVSTGSGSFVSELSAWGDIETGTYSGSYEEAMAFVNPLRSLYFTGEFGNCILSGYSEMPIRLSGVSPYTNVHDNVFFNTVYSTSETRVNFEGRILSADPLFADTIHYFLKTTSPYGPNASPGDMMGYAQPSRGGPQVPGDEAYHDGPSPVMEIKRQIAGLHAIQLSWTPLPDSEEVAFYRIYRVVFDSTQWKLESTGYWDYTESDTISPFAEVTVSSFLDTTVKISQRYIYAIEAVDSLGNHGKTLFPSPPHISDYTIGITFESFGAANKLAVAGKQWNMIAPWGADSISVPNSPSQTIYRWDDTKNPDKLFSNYTVSPSMHPGKGYWFYSESDTAFEISPESFHKLASSNIPVTISLTKGATGWNQISSPFPFPVAPDWLPKFHPYTWIASEKRYNSAVNVIKPWEAVWVHTDKDTTLTIDGTAFLGSLAKSAKRLSPAAWEIKVMISGNDFRDPDNYLGVISPLAKVSATTEKLEPPQAFNCPRLFFVKEGRSNEIDGHRKQLSTYYQPSSSLPHRRLEWLTAITESNQDVTLQFELPPTLPEGLHLFWASKDSVRALGSYSSFAIPARNETVYGVVVATANPMDIALYSNRLALRSAYPNPFRRATTIEFAVPMSWTGTGLPQTQQRVQVMAYDLKGRLVSSLVNGTIRSGHHRVIWNGTGEAGHVVAPGVYVVRLQAGNKTKTTRILKVK